MGRFGIKLVGLLLLISLCAFVISLVLVDEVLQVSQATLRGRTKELEGELRAVPPIYRELLLTKGRYYNHLADRMAESPHLTYAVWQRDAAALRWGLAQLMKQNPEAVRLAVHDTNERSMGAVGTSGPTDSRYRVSKPIGSTGWTLLASFPLSKGVDSRFQQLGRVLGAEHHYKRIDRALQPRFYPMYVRYFAIAMLMVTVVGVLFARRMARRVAQLSQATRKVAAGDLDVAVSTRSRDEIGQLNAAFNNMVAEMRRNRAQIAYLQKISAWQEVARRLAHEIKNPLTPILLSIQQVQEKYEGTDPKFRKLLDDAAEIVHEEIDGLRRLVEAFSAFSKLPQVQAEPESVDLLMDDFSRSLGALEGQGELDWEPPEPGFSVQVDRLLFRRVLFNLVENAYQAVLSVGGTPRVEIRTRQLVHSGVALITVTDNGPGIPDDLLERVFDPYFTTKSSGTGLGLAIVKKIVLEHGGSIDVECPAEGGTRFTIRIPVA